jgi:hypothetical protein
MQLLPAGVGWLPKRGCLVRGVSAHYAGRIKTQVLFLAARVLVSPFPVAAVQIAPVAWNDTLGMIEVLLDSFAPWGG